jgi:hypothetical protein
MIGKRFVFYEKLGLNTNGDVFFKIAKVFPFQSSGKCQLEFRGITVWKRGFVGYEKEDNYYKDLKSRFNYLSHKYQRESLFEQVQFLSIDQIIFQQYDFPSQHFEHHSLAIAAPFTTR